MEEKSGIERSGPGSEQPESSAEHFGEICHQQRDDRTN